ncbi:hypothetical protein [Acinetobacter modestus]|uniref:hypothetical protein n=1 Tax=Acinetobacter modestus TaxID=1776740 RepID=UPI003209453A
MMLEVFKSTDLEISKGFFVFIECYRVCMNNICRYTGIEIIKFLLPVIITFFSAFVFSNMFSNEKLFESYLLSRIGENLSKEIFSILIAITLILGIIVIIQRVSGLSWLDKLIDLLIYEIPNNIYLFGGVVTGSMYSLACYSSLNNTNLDQTPFQIFILGSFFALIFFSYGSVINYFLVKNKRDK